MYKYIDENKEHLHTLDGKPLIGTSSVMSVLAKPLTWWASGLAVEKLGWINSKKKIGTKYVTTPTEARISHVEPFLKEICTMTPEDYLKRLDEAYKAHSVKLDSSAKDGTDLHAEIENYVKECIKEGRVIDKKNAKIQPFIDFALEKVKRFIWSEANCFSREHWLGGITDIGMEDNEGKYAIIDIKSSKEAYKSQFYQCAGYDIQIEENGLFDKDGNLIMKLDKPIEYYIIFPFGMEKPEPQYFFDVVGAKKCFLSALTLYRYES